MCKDNDQEAGKRTQGTPGGPKVIDAPDIPKQYHYALDAAIRSMNAGIRQAWHITQENAAATQVEFGTWDGFKITIEKMEGESHADKID